MSGLWLLRVEMTPPMTPRSPRAASRSSSWGVWGKKQAQGATRPFPGRLVAPGARICFPGDDRVATEPLASTGRCA